MNSIIWLVVLIVFLVAEDASVGLVSIWFAVGALGGLIVSRFGFGIWVELAVFLILSAISMALLRPLTKKILKPNYTPTNVDRLVGSIGVITEDVDNIAGTGAVKLSGQIWSAKAASQEISLTVGQEVRVKEIQGVKAVVTPLEDKHAS